MNSAVRLGPMLFMLGVNAPLYALDPAPKLSQYAHTAWRVQDGTFSGAPTAIAQTKDGFLWIGTRSGLYRFDGSEIQPFAPNADEPLRSPRIISLLAASDGSLWIGTGNDLERFKNGQLTHYPKTRGFIFGYVMKIHEDRKGRIWFVRARVSDDSGPLCQVMEAEVRCYGKSAGITSRYAGGDLLEDAAGAFWLHSDHELFHWSPASAQTVPLPLNPDQVVDGIQSLAFDPGGTLWVGTADSSRGLGLARIENGVLRPATIPGIDSATLSVQTLMYDSSHALWIGTLAHGLYRVLGSRVEHFGAIDGLTSDSVNGLFEDAEGDVWIATTGGVDRFRDLRVLTVSTREGLSTDSVNAVVAGRDGTIWFSNWHALDSIRDGVVSTIKSGAGLPGEEVTSLFEDRRGRLWVGVDKQLMLYEHHQFTPVKRRDGSLVGQVQAITQDAAGSVWVVAGPPGETLMRIDDSQVTEEVSSSQVPFALTRALAPDKTSGIWLARVDGDLALWRDGKATTVAFGHAAHTANISSMVSLPDGAIVAGTPLGLIAWREGKKRTLTAENGMPCTHVWSVISDAGGTLWMYSDCGLLSLSPAEQLRWWQDGSAKVNLGMLDGHDGVQPAYGSFYPTSSRGPDGRLWFANSTIAQVFDPAKAVGRAYQPPISIQRIAADQKALNQTSLIIPALTRELQIDYAAPSFLMPERVRFRYRLVGESDQWVDVLDRRSAFFTNPRPGHYRFEVSASDTLGQWNGSKSQVEFTVAPTFYQTRWFLGLCIAGLLVLLGVAFWLRMRWMLARLQERMEERLAERERIARTLHDTLLQSMQGLLYRFQSLLDRLPPADETRRLMHKELDRADRVLAEGRDQIAGLSVSEVRKDLVNSLTAFGNVLSSERGIPFRTHVEGEPRELNPGVSEEIYYLIGEGLNNAFKHAEATEVILEVAYQAAEFNVRIRDNGKGISKEVLAGRASRTHMGLASMRARGHQIRAHLEWWTTSSVGTEVILSVPGNMAYGPRSAGSIGLFVRRILGMS